MGSVWPPGVGLWYNMYESIGVVSVCKKKQVVLILVTKLNFTERAPQSEHQHCRAGERGPR